MLNHWSHFATLAAPPVVQILSALAVAASFVPSDDDVIHRHTLVLPTLVSSVHEAPESVDVQILPPQTTAASFAPSDDDVIDNQFFVLPTLVFSVHETVNTCAGVQVRCDKNRQTESLTHNFFYIQH